MEKSQKVQLVEELQDKFKRANATFIADYKGIKSIKMDELRKTLRDASIEFKVVRNTLAKRAIKGTELEPISPNLKNSTAVIFSFADAAFAAKTLVQFAKDQPQLKLRMGTLGTRAITADDIRGLAELPPREVLLGRMLGSMMSPVSGFVRVIAGVPTKFLYALNAIKDQKASAEA
ncbi:MAG: 50S ribosomal protein L10 [Deltaproteobacteria bacterium]|nr:50S ribosomal protein L10 [Deltaproteobacteria bacterium]